MNCAALGIKLHYCQIWALSGEQITAQLTTTMPKPEHYVAYLSGTKLVHELAGRNLYLMITVNPMLSGFFEMSLPGSPFCQAYLFIDACLR
jgi:hypothetical protein